MKPQGLLMRLLLVTAFVTVPAAGWAQRTVEANRLVSSSLPAATLEVDRSLEYAGTQTIDLYGLATAEQHFFVERDGNRVKRLLWVQFEGYLPSNDHTYNYRDSTIAYAGHDWHRRIAATKVPDHDPRPDSDGARARALLRAKGWTMGSDVLTERLVWLLDRPARHELMLIYLEDLGNGLTATDLAPAGSAFDRWPAIAEAFHRRALGSFTIGGRP